MKIRVVIPIVYLKLEGAKEYTFEQFAITNDFEVKKKLTGSKSFIEQFGLLNQAHILENSIIYYEGDPKDLPMVKDCQTLYEIGNTISSFIPRLVDCLWFIKDNSCYVNHQFYESVDENLVFLRTSNSLTSTYDGQFRLTTFDLAEIHMAYMIFCILMGIATIEGKLPPRPEGNGVHSVTPNHRNLYPYTFNRMVIALNFFSLARQDSSPIIKTTFYVAVLEALFSTKNSTPYSRKIPQRTAAFIGVDDSHVLRHYNSVRQAYGVRSDYIHGNVVNAEREHLLRVCLELDLIVRFVLMKAITSEKEVFTPDFKPKFGDYFGKLVLKYNHVFPVDDNKSKCETD